MALRIKKEKAAEAALNEESEALEEDKAEGKTAKRKTAAKEEPAAEGAAAGRILVPAAKTLLTRNEVRITGTAVSAFQVQGQHTTVITIATSAGRAAANSRRKAGADIEPMSNFPKVAFYGPHSSEVYSALGLDGDKAKRPQVTVTGMVQTSKQQRGSGFVYRQTIVGNYCEIVPTHLELALMSGPGTGAATAGDENEVVIIGEIVHIYRFSGNVPGTILTIRTADERINFPKVTLFRNLDKLSHRMEDGDHVALVGMVQTKRVMKDGKPFRHENIVATDLDWYKG